MAEDVKMASHTLDTSLEQKSSLVQSQGDIVFNYRYRVK